MNEDTPKPQQKMEIKEVSHKKVRKIQKKKDAHAKILKLKMIIERIKRTEL